MCASAVLHAHPARAAEPPPAWGIIDVQGWQEVDTPDTAVWVSGSLTPAPSIGTATIRVVIPGVLDSTEEAGLSSTGEFRERLLLPPGTAGVQQLRPSVDPSLPSGPGRVQAADGQVDALQFGGLERVRARGRGPLAGTERGSTPWRSSRA